MKKKKTFRELKEKLKIIKNQKNNLFKEKSIIHRLEKERLNLQSKLKKNEDKFLIIKNQNQDIKLKLQNFTTKLIQAKNFLRKYVKIKVNLKEEKKSLLDKLGKKQKTLKKIKQQCNLDGNERKELEMMLEEFKQIIEEKEINLRTEKTRFIQIKQYNEEKYRKNHKKNNALSHENKNLHKNKKQLMKELEAELNSRLIWQAKSEKLDKDKIYQKKKIIEYKALYIKLKKEKFELEIKIRKQENDIDRLHDEQNNILDQTIQSLNFSRNITDNKSEKNFISAKKNKIIGEFKFRKFTNNEILKKRKIKKF